MSCRFLKQAAAISTILLVAIAGCKKDDPVKVSGVSLDKPTLELEAGGSGTLVATIAPADAENKAVTWSSSNDAVATVDQNGAVKAVAAGTATITVTTADGGFTAGCVVTVMAGNNGEKPDITALRYETVPYSAGEAKSGGAYKLAYSDYDDEYNYYFFVLGRIESVPLAYRPAIYYKGVTPMNVSYSHSDVTQKSISTSIQDAVTHSFTQSSSTNWELGLEAGIDIEVFKAQVSAKMGGSSGWDETNSRSLSNTYETASSTVSEDTDILSATIGEHGEPVGRYRWALFTTTDVYYYVKTDRERTRVVEAFTEFCARPNPSWTIDYDPDEAGSFGKTGKGELLEIPEIDPSTLPDPHPHEWGEWEITIPATCETEGTETRTCTLDPLHTETRTIPATGHQWEWKITKEPTANTPGEAIRICKNDPAHTESLHFKAIYVKSDFNHMNVENSTGVYIWQHPEANLDIENLKKLGYTKVSIKVDFRHRAGISGSECGVSVINGENGVHWADTKYSMAAFAGWYDRSFTITNLPLDEYSKNFSVRFTRLSTFNFTVGERTVTVTAIK